MLGRSATCKKCNNPFKIEEQIDSPNPLEFKPIYDDSIERKTKRNRSNKLEPETGSFMPLSHQRSKKRAHKRPFIIAIALLGIVALLFIGNYHVIRGGSKGLSIVRRDSIGFGEFFINADEITGIPSVSAKKRFPLGYKVLQGEGIIKSDEASKKMIDEAKQRELDEAFREAQKEIDKMTKEAQRASDSAK